MRWYCHTCHSLTVTLWRMCKALGSLPTVRLERRLAKLPDDVMVKIKRALTFALDLGTEA